jgi:hypothetical protein
MDEPLLSLRRLPMIILAALLVIPTGCLPTGERSTPGPLAVNVSPEATASPAGSTPALPTADPTLTTEIVTATPVADLPVAPVPGARAPDFTLTDLNGNEVSLGDLRGQAVLVNFWATW